MTATTAAGLTIPDLLRARCQTQPERAAIINGRIISVGESGDTGSGPAVHVREVGPDYAIIDGANGPVTLKMEEHDGAKSAGETTNTASASSNPNPATAKPTGAPAPTPEPFHYQSQQRGGSQARGRR